MVRRRRVLSSSECVGITVAEWQCGEVWGTSKLYACERVHRGCARARAARSKGEAPFESGGH